MGIGYALLLGFGMVLVIEGMAFALAPRRMEDLLRVLAGIPIENPPHDRTVRRGLRRDRSGAGAGCAVIRRPPATISGHEILRFNPVTRM